MKVASTLVDMYSKCGCMEKAGQVFQRMINRDVVSWNAIIMGYAQSGEGELALQLFARMQEEGFTPNARTIVAALQACGDLAGNSSEDRGVKSWCLRKGREIHLQLLNSDHQCSDIFVANKLVDMYAKCGSLADACQVFNRMPLHDLVSYNVMLFGFADSGEGDLALELYENLQEKGITPNAQTYVAALKACAISAAKEEASGIEGKLLKVVCLEKGMRIHFEVSRTGDEADIKVASTLVDMYAKCGSMENACRVFYKMKRRDVVAWNSILMGYAQSGEGELALELFARMKEDGVTPDALAYVAAFKACGEIAGKEEGRKVDGTTVKTKTLEKVMTIRDQIAGNEYKSDLKLANTLLDVYAKCGSMVDALVLFEKMASHRDEVSWNAMILGYCQAGEAELALQYFARMQEEGVVPNEVTLMAVLKACGQLGALRTGMMVYEEFCEAGLGQDQALTASSMIGFYGKCGSMEEAHKLFDSLATKQLVTWNTLISGYAQQGNSDRVFELFERMQKEKIQMDDVTFVSVLSACSHAGLVEKGKNYFDTMCSSMTPRIEHYACMVDLMGRANHLDEAVALLRSMPCEANLSIWRSLLAAAWKWKNVGIAKLAFEAILKLDDKDAAAYVLMANTYAAVGMWEESARARADSNKKTGASETGKL